jgi:hypothetical protein
MPVYGPSFGALGLSVSATAIFRHLRGACYHRWMFNFGKPKTPGDWIVHIAGAIVALFLVWWMLRVYVL